MPHLATNFRQCLYYDNIIIFSNFKFNSRDWSKIIIYPNFDPMGVSKAQKLKMNALKCPKMSWYHHYISIDENHWTRWGSQKSQDNNFLTLPKIVPEITKNLQIFGLQPWILNFFSQSIEQFFLTKDQNNFGNKIPIQISEIRITVQRWWLEAWNETEAKLNESFRASQRVSTEHHRDGFSFWLYRVIHHKVS